MKKFFTRMLCAVLTLMVCIGCMGFSAFAATTTEDGNVWYGDEISMDIKEGKNGYTFISAYVKPRHAYEMSYHMVSNDGGSSNDIPQLLVLTDASKDSTWTPDGPYTFGASNYEVLYCCDAETGYDNGIYYKRMNLEDSTYYNEEEAAHIRAIVTNSYPFISMEQMKKNLADSGFEGAEDLTRADIISAVQAAIWAFSNVNSGEYYYSQTFNVPDNSQWGGIIHDYDNELDKENESWWPAGKRKFAKNEEVAARINALIDYLKNADKVYAEENQVIISHLEIVDHAPVYEKDGVYTVALQLALNNSGSSVMDEINVDIYVGGKLYKTLPVELGKDVYNINVEAAAGESIKAVVSGTQMLPQGVYFYEAEGGREVSQSLVGVAGGETDVYSEAEVALPAEEVPPVKAELSIHKVDQAGYSLPGVSFELYAAGENTDIYVDTYTVDENGMLNITDLLPGSYKIVESVAHEGYVKLDNAITIVVTEDGLVEAAQLPEGVTLENSVLTVTNESTTITVFGEKVWDDEDDADGIRPETITVNLYANNVKIDSVTVSEADGWLWSFENLYKYENGIEIVYTIDEDVVEGYTTEITGSVEEGFVIENTHIPELTEIDDPDVPLAPPKTGDNMMLWLAAAIASAAFIVFFFAYTRKKVEMN